MLWVQSQSLENPDLWKPTGVHYTQKSSQPDVLFNLPLLRLYLAEFNGVQARRLGRVRILNVVASAKLS